MGTSGGPSWSPRRLLPPPDPPRRPGRPRRPGHRRGPHRLRQRPRAGRAGVGGRADGPRLRAGHGPQGLPAPRSPCRAVRLPKVEREEMRFLNPAEVATLADVIDSRYRALVLVGAYEGLRMGPPKTRAGRRIVTLSRAVVEELVDHLGRVGTRTATCSPPTRAGCCGRPTSGSRYGCRRCGRRGWRRCGP
jgi:integrase